MKEKILAAYEQMAERYNALIDHKPHNAHYDRPNTLSLFPAHLQGKVILDAACGPGKYAGILMAKGATVTGFDLSPKMIQLARERNEGRGEFFVHDLTQKAERIPSASCDFVLSALALHYIPDWNPAIREFYRVLKPNGKLIISVEHPFFEYIYFKAKNYFAIENVKGTWKGFGSPVEVHSYRRPLDQCITPLTNNGFLIDKLLEPLPTEEFEKLDPDHYKELNQFPAFLCIRAVKSASSMHAE
ncbi:class I SAM-dependent methyltransferase [Roseivirga sp. BDSF3-8]|uniref:class I SAM-dependent methyltransferase n=1 Tax=Roseivirga sp. BDSF3-8 TaxID=3241598 RepID=UPI003532476C